MELSALAVTAITNFILAGQAFFIGGLFAGRPKARFSAAWFWQLALLMLALTALLGGIDHGFFEIHGQTPVRKALEHTNWFLIGLLTFFVFLTTTRQFLLPPWQRAAEIAAVAQLVVYTGLILWVDNFLVVMINYAPVMLLLLALSLRGLRDGTGTWAMVLGVLVGFSASGVQAAGVDIFSPIDRNSLYHFGMMAAVVFFYHGGLRLKGLAPP